MSRQTIWLSLLAMVAMACSSGGSAVQIFQDATDNRYADEQSEPDLKVPDTAEVLDLAPADLEVIEPDFGPACKPGDGCFLDPCDDGSDCLSGLCVGHMGDTVCTQTCVEECPDGWSCEQIGTGPDAMFACISPYTHLCRPCTTNADCQSATGVEDLCLDFGPDGRFCGANCGEEGICPTGYSCSEALTVNGVTKMQCLPDSGLCACSNKSIELALSTPCYEENEFGLCEGERICVEEGLTDCDAPIPAEEVCDGVDNDCNGETDEGTCGDDNECTEDSCDPDAGCVYEPLTGTDCNDEDVCTLADHCDNGECVGTAINCDDDNVCTTDSCDPAGGCIYTFNTQPCDDDDPCTINDACKQGSCVGFAVPCDCKVDLDCVPLEDDDVCNGTLFCDTDQFPQKCAVAPDTIIECEEPAGIGAECLEAACHPQTGECSFHPKADGKVCDDGNACTIGDVCLEGACISETALNCNDGNSCTDDACDPSSGCTYTNNESPCDDNNVCTVGDACLGGACLSGAPLDCDDNNVCTDDGCDTELGCTHTANTAPCDDNNSCTTNDICVNGQCQGAGSLECDDGNPCTKDICLPDGGCAYENIPGSCQDGDPCTLNDTCIDGACTPGASADCNDGNVCTDDSCDGETGECVHTPNEAACSDGNACTVNDHCTDGACVNDGTPDCDDGNVCTSDWCDPATGCQHTDNTNPCDDDNACTIGDVCLDGACKSGPALNCNDGNLCTDDSCDPEAGCQYADNSNPCNDGNACTTGDVCQDGSCTGQDSLKCNDGNPCTDDSCDLLEGCLHEPNSVLCNDGNPCTTGDICANGSCGGIGVLDCDDGNLCTNDSCDPDTGCVHTNNTAPCNDNNLCTPTDVCANGTCVGQGSLNCNDNNVCTDDSCSPQDGCVHAANTAPCNDNNTCTTGDVCADGVCAGTGSLECDDDNVCTKDICLPGGGCQNTPIAGPCDDGNPCTVNDSCVDGACVPGAAPDCDDGNVCTDDSCGPDGSCVHAANSAACNDGNACTVTDKCSAGTCVGSGTPDCDDGNLCTTDWCDPQQGCLHANNSAPCDDGDACTTGDTCSAGSCAGTGELSCNDNNPCTDDACDVDTGCLFVPNEDPCNDGNACTTTDVCSEGVCVGANAPDCDDNNVCTTDWCDPLDGCMHTLNSAPCDDGDACTTGDVCNAGNCAGTGELTCNDGNGCTNDSCNPASGCVFTNNTAACDDLNACTTGDTCANGQCQPGSALSCDDGNYCTTDTCNPVTGCVHTNNTAPCDDGNLCTTADTCSNGSCQGGPALNCNDGNVCTDDSCNSDTGCVNSNNTAACNDNNVCTNGDVCLNGTCMPGAPIVCNDGDNCTSDSCDPTNGCTYTPITPCCGNGAVENGEECDDGNTVGGDGCEADCTLPDVCEWSGVTQLYCNGWCSWAGPDGCDQADADIYCKLKHCNCAAYATSFQVVDALAQPGFACNPGYGTNYGTAPEYCVNVDVWYQDSSILANHGPGSVVTNVNCVVP